LLVDASRLRDEAVSTGSHGSVIIAGIARAPRADAGADGHEAAQRAGLQGWLVRTGKFRDEVLRQSSITPDRIVTSVAELAMYL